MSGKAKRVVVPMVSTFKADKSVDKEAAVRIASRIVDVDAEPFVLGSTGEGTSMSMRQKIDMVEAVASVTKGKSTLFAGISANSVDTAIEEAEIFAQKGADILVATLPFYYPIDEDQMTLYFKYIADNIPLPLVIYNMPGMVKRSIPLEVAEELSHHRNIIGLKDSERNEERMIKSIEMWKDRDDFSFLIGWAAISSKGLQLGADGIVPSTGNLYPELYTELLASVLNGDIVRADELQEKTNLFSSLYQKDRDLSHSIPVLKSLMSEMGLCTNEVLLPMLNSRK